MGVHNLGKCSSQEQLLKRYITKHMRHVLLKFVQFVLYKQQLVRLKRCMSLSNYAEFKLT